MFFPDKEECKFCNVSTDGKYTIGIIEVLCFLSCENNQSFPQWAICQKCLKKKRKEHEDECHHSVELV